MNFFSQSLVSAIGLARNFLSKAAYVGTCLVWLLDLHRERMTQKEHLILRYFLLSSGINIWQSRKVVNGSYTVLFAVD